MGRESRTDRKEVLRPQPSRVVDRVRGEVARRYVRGCGLEIGAGARPFPLPAGSAANYGDIRNEAELKMLFKTTSVTTGMRLDAQTLFGVVDASLDFLVYAHVIEHLRDPLGALVNGLRVLKRRKPFIIVVPEMRFTFDRNRPEVSVDHMLADFQDGGEGTTFQAYEEHLRFVHPYLTGEHYDEAEIRRQASESAKRWRDFDVHFHAWTRSGFEGFLRAASAFAPFSLEETLTVEDENIFVVKKRDR